MAWCLTPEEMFDRSFGGEDRTNEIPHWFDNIVLALVVAACKVITRYEIHGKEHVRALQGETGAVMACNHMSYLDIPFLWASVRPRQKVRIIAREDLFDKNFAASQLLARCGAFPIARDSADMKAVKRAVRMLKNKELVGIFPEGTRRGKSGKTPELHAGVALIARMGKAPIVPCGVSGSEKVKVKGDWRVHFPKVHFRIGEPVYVSWFDFLPKDERLQGCAWYVMRACFALSRDVAPEEVDMRELFPEAKDYADVFAGWKPGEAS